MQKCYHAKKNPVLCASPTCLVVFILLALCVGYGMPTDIACSQNPLIFVLFFLQVGVFWVGTGLSVGLIPPGQTAVYSSSICQLKIDEEIAPGGVNVFAYLPHMHNLGRRMWTDHLVDPVFRNESTSYVTDLKELQKV